MKITENVRQAMRGAFVTYNNLGNVVKMRASTWSADLNDELRLIVEMIRQLYLALDRLIKANTR